MPRIANSRRSRTSCSLIALATVMVVGASPAAAQSFAGTGTFTHGSGLITTSPDTTSISVTTPSAVIDWTSAAMSTVNNGVPIVFQPAGTTANFSGGGNYAVLNRLNVVDSTRVIQLNGTIQTIASGALNGTGSIYFYSPSGFMLGGTSVINVPALVLSALPIAVDGSGNFITGTLPNRSVTFGSPVNPAATISTAATSQITANQSGSYVAMVAPNIVHNGTVTVNGSAALVAAEAATINFSTDGLFDIQVTVGTTHSAGITVNGDITGPTPTGPTDKQGIYLVAVPKNDALTMVIGSGSDLGFTLANSAVDDNGVIVLSAGHDIVDGAIGAKSAGHGANATGNFWFTGAHATNNLFGEATGDANLYSVAPNLTTTFDNDVTVHAANVNMSVSGVGTTLTVGGDLNLSASRTGTAGQSVTAGNVQLYALNNGSLSVAGSTSLTANAIGGNASTGTAGSGTGGTIYVNTDDGGSLSLHALTASATGTGGNGTSAGVHAGSGTGGTVSMYADSGSGLVVDGATTLTARGFGGSSSGNGLAGNGTGGVARIYVGDNSSLTFNGSVGLHTDGTGGSSNGSANGGTGTGGSSRITAVLGSTTGGLVTINGAASLSADGTGGSSNSGLGGDGIGGFARMFSAAHHYVINGTATFSAAGEGGNSVTSTGGTGQGGTAEIVSVGSEVDISGTVNLDAPGYGGGGLVGGDGLGGNINIISENDISLAGNVVAFAEGEGAQGNGGNGGYGEGGVIDITADGGTLSLGSLTAVSYGQGGDHGGSGTAAGDGQGGNIFINALDGGGLSVTNNIDAIAEAYGGRHGLNVSGGSGTGGYVELLAAGTGSQINVGGNVSLNALAYGQYADCFSCSGTAGDAFGGTIYVAADGADIAIGGNLVAETNAEGGRLDAGGTTGDGFGGDISILSLADGNLGIAGSLTATADGLGGGNFGFGTNTGSGTGGNVVLQAFGADAVLSVGSWASVTANGESGPFCGECGGGGLAGNGTGGNVTVQAYGADTASLTISGNLNAEANGQGGDAITGNGGTGEGGSVYIGANDGAYLHLGSLSAAAEGWGGYSYGPGNGGTGTGGVVTLSATGDGTLEIDFGGYLDVDGYGGGAGLGSTGDGGDGVGGIVGVYANGGSIDIGFLLSAAAEGHGGYSANATGGDGFGRNAEVFANNGGSISIDGLLSLSVDGFGGGGITGGDGIGGGVPDPDSGGTDGVHIRAKNGTVTVTGASSLSADGQGGAGANGGAGGDGSGGWATIHAANSNIGPSNITLGTVNISANATGGAGGQGTSGNQGGDGGAGGSATAGTATVFANAGNGHLLAGDVFANAVATGGQGGDGGNGDGLGGGNGGAGGHAQGGHVAVGTASGNGEATGSNLGTATYASITADSSASGGSGGHGNSGSTGGDGGDGGDAFGGSSVLLVRGSTVTVGGASLMANATGGNAGFGYQPEVGEPGTTGIGGDATVGGDGGIHVLVTSRHLFPEQRGTLNADWISGSATATAGIGIPNGVSSSLGGSQFTFLNSDGQIGAVDLLVQLAGVNTATSGVDSISLINSSVLNFGDFSFETPGNLSVYVDQGSLTTGSLYLSAGDFVPDSTYGDTFTDLGLITAGSAQILTGNNFIATADFDIGSSLAIDAPGFIDAHNFTVDGNLDLSANGGTLTADNLAVTGNVDLHALGAINLDTVLAGSFEADAGGTFDSNNITADTDIRILAGDDISLGDLAAGEDIDLATPEAMLTGDIVAGGLFRALGHGDMVFGNATAAEIFLADFAIVAPSAAGICIGNCGTLGANGVVTAPPEGSSYYYVTTANGLSGAGQLGGVGGTNGSQYTTTEFTAAAGEDLAFWFNYVTSDGSGFADYAWAGLFTPTGTDPVAILFTARTQPEGTIVPGQGLPGVEATLDPSSVPIIGGATLWDPLGGSSGGCYSAGCGYTGWIGSTYSIGESGTYVLRFGVSNWGDTSFDTGMAFSGITIGGVPVQPTAARTGGSITIGNVDTGKFTAAAGTSLTTGVIDSSGSMALDAGGAISTGNLFAGAFVLANGDSITTGNIEAASVDMTSTGGDILADNINAFGAVAMDAFGDITVGDIGAGSIDLVAGNDIETGDLTTPSPLVLAAAEGPSVMLFPGASVTLESGGDISTGNISSSDGVYADAGGSLTTLAIDAADFVQINSGGSMTTGNITAGTDLFADSGAAMNLGALSANDIELDSGGNMTFGNINAVTEIDFSSGGSVNGGNVTAGLEIFGDASGAVTLGNLTSGFDPGDEIDDDIFAIGIAAGGNITVSNATGARAVGFATLGNLTTGNISAGELVMTLANGNISTGSITTSAEGGGQIYMADDSMFLTGGGTLDGEGDFDPNIVLALDPVATGGSITINGPVSTGLFRAAAGTGLTTQAMTADNVEASAGGTAILNGLWDISDSVLVRSNDIDITSSGGIDAEGFLTLVSTNGTQMLIGDGLTGTGYALSNAEFGRISGYEVSLIGRGDASAAIDMLVGTLDVTGPLAGSNVEGSDLNFATYDFEGESPASGVIRVVGNVNATGFGIEADQSINFFAGRFELDAATGSISIFSSGSTLGGELGLYANRIHVAAGSILDQLAVNPTYTNYQQDLNEAAAVQRPEGVLRADTLWIESDNLQDILIQNTGTTATPAGFLVRQAFVNDDDEVAGPPGSINMVVNGQVVTEGGTLTGVAARDALITPEDDTTPFTSNSTINGCPLTGQCVIRPPAPPPNANIVQNQIDLFNSNPLGDSEFGNEPDIDDNQEGDDGAGSPISPPQPLFDTRPLIPASEVNDPVSGTGNPALLGSEQCDAEGENQCPTEGDSQ